MRSLIFALSLLAAACGPAPQSADTAPAPAATEEAPVSVDPYVAALAATPATGEWIARSDARATSACFGEPQSECQIVVSCERGRLKLLYEHELVPDQATTLRLFTATSTLDLPAHSFNEGLPSVTVDLAADAPERLPLIGALGAPTDRFGVEVAGEQRVFPWHDTLAAALIACR